MNPTALSPSTRATQHAEHAASIPHRFRAVARRHGERPALRSQGGCLSYADLADRVARLARALGGRGVGAEQAVALHLERTPDLIVAILAVLEVGAYYVPLDPDHSSERAEAILADSGAGLLLTDGRRTPLSRRIPTLVVAAGVEAGADGGTSVDRRPDLEAHAEQLAYCIFTSGSSGRPKGVGVTCRNLLRLFDTTAPEFRFDHRDVWLLFHSPAFDFSVWEIFGALLYGGTLVLPDRATTRDPERLVELLRRHRVSVLNQTPSAFQQLSRHLESAGARIDDLALRLVLFGGETLRPATLRAWFDRAGARGPRLFNLYGITETTVHVTRGEIRPEDCAAPDSPLGTALDDLRVHLLDAALRPVAPGAIGEIHVGGAGVARGYLGRAGLTAARFVPDPWSEVPGGRLYRSGDLARLDARGRLLYLGRADRQVQVRGYRVELGEIEARLLEHPAVRAATVEALPPLDTEAGAETLGALVVAAGSTGSDSPRHRLPNGLVVEHVNRFETDYMYEEIFRRQVYRRWGITIQRGDRVVDVGANIGLFLLYAACCADDLDVLALEPVPDVWRRLERNLRRYLPGARALRCAAGARRGELRLRYYPHATVLSGGALEGAESRRIVAGFVRQQLEADGGTVAPELVDQLLADRLRAETTTSPVAPLSDLIDRHGLERIDLLKVDVEGAEHEVLRGLEERHWPRIRQVVVEVHDVDGRAEAIARELRDRGFATASETVPGLEGSGLRMLWASRDGLRPDPPPVLGTPAGLLARAASGNKAGEGAGRRLDDRRLQRDLRRHVARRLPEYMRPSHYVLADSIPLTPNGKLDRRAARRRLERARRASSHPAVAIAGDGGGDATGAERIAIELWSELLAVENLEPDDDVFELGAHSLMVTRFAARLRADHGLDLPLRRPFEAPRIADHAAAIRPWRQEPLAPPEPNDDEGPLTFSQERIWFETRLEPDTLAYNAQCAFRFRGPLRTELLEEALAEMVRRHEIYRTTFHCRRTERGADALRQVVHSEAKLHIDRQEADDEDDARRRTRAWLQHRFDLERLPLVRWLLLRVGGVASENDGPPPEHHLIHCEHHIVHDGWSFNRFRSELLEIYRALTRGDQPERPRGGLRFVDFARRQRRTVRGAPLRSQLAHWRRELSPPPPRLQLPRDRPPRERSLRAGATLRQRLPADLHRRLRRFGREHRVTLYMTMLAAYCVVLHRRTGQTDLGVGCSVANRRWADTENLLGMLVNNVVIRSRIEATTTLGELLDAVRKRTLAAYENQDAPFERVVAAVAPERDGATNPLFQTMFGFHDSPRREVDLEGLEVEVVEAIENGSAKFDLTLTVIPEGAAPGHDSPVDELTVVWEYDISRLSADSVAEMAAQLERLLSRLEQSVAMAVSDLALDPSVDGLPRTVLDGPRVDHGAAFLHGAVGSRIEQTPRRTAVLAAPGGDRREIRWSYAQLDERARSLELLLRERGVGPDGPPVAIALEPSPELVAALVAVSRCGAAYLPLEPGDPEERIAWMLEDSGAALVVTEPGVRRRSAALRRFDGELLTPLDQYGAPAGARSESAVAAPRRVPLDAPAYVLYTSGSTGRPRGVVVSHRAAAHHMAWMQRALPLLPDDRVLQKTPVSFDASVWEFWAPLGAGATLVVAPPGAYRDPALLLRAVERGAITVLQVVPALLRLLVERPELERCASLRRILCGGETLPPDLADEVARRRPDLELWNVYGPTEATIHATAHRCRPQERGATVPIGRPIDNTRVAVLDARLRPVAAGAVGELFVAGPGLAQGYLGRAAATAERFLPDPHGPPGSRLYSTGDRGRLLPDGSLEILGRTDRQLKVRGVRIDPGEIEARLRACPGVREAVVVAQRRDGDVALTAFWTASVGANDGERETESRLRRELQRFLPRAMVPERLSRLEHLPRTPAGKTDVRALEALPPEVAVEEPRDAEPAPPGALEQDLRSLWRDALAVARVGADDNFFDLGGHSLLAARLAQRLGERCGVEVPVRSFFDHPTPRALSAAIERLAAAAESRPARDPRLEPEARDRGSRGTPLTSPQRCLWYLQQLDRDASDFTVASCFELRGHLDRARLAAALRRLADDHEILRARFVVRDGEPRMVPDAPPVELAMEDAPAASDRFRRSSMQWGRERLAAWLRRPFELAAEAPIRGLLLRLSERRHLLAIAVHHLATDGRAQGLLLRELAALYARRPAGFAGPARPPSFLDVARRRPGRERGAADRASLLARWRERLDGWRPTTLLPDRVPGRRRGGRPLLFRIDHRGARALRRLGSEHGASLYMVLLAAFARTLGRHAGERHVLLGSPVSTRDRAAMDEVLGMFVSTLPLCLDLGQATNFAELLRHTRGRALEALGDRHLPLDELAPKLRRLGRPGDNPFYRVTFALQTELERRPGLDLPGIESEPLEIERRSAQSDLAVQLWESDDGLTGELSFDASRYRPRRMRRFLGDYLALIERVSAADRLEGLSLEPSIRESPREARPAAREGTAASAPGALLGELLEGAGGGGDSASLEEPATRRSLRGRRLAERVGRRAVELRSAGFGPDDLVAVGPERRLETVLDALAALRAGAAFVPLDPALPATVRRRMLRTAAAQTRGASGDGGSEANRCRAVQETLESALAYALPTAGTTGEPKLVAVSRGALASYLRAAVRVYGLSPGDRVLQLSPLTSDISVEEILAPLAAGATVVLGPDALRSSASELLRFCRRQRITVLTLPTALWHRLADALCHASGTVPSGTVAGDTISDAVPKTLRLVIVGGEPLDPRRSARWRELLPELPLIDTYGPTEATVVATARHEVSTTVGEALGARVGRPFGRCTCFVLDDALRPLPPGTAGELFVGGPQVARGYLGDPRTTASRFVPDPWSATPGDRLYRTGDRARWTVGGELELLGRIDRQIKIRGYRVEPAGVERCLARHPGVAQAAVVAAPGPGRETERRADDRLVAWVTPSAARVPGPADRAALIASLEDHVRRHLATHQRPSRIHLCSELPLTERGKVDLDALARRSLDADRAAPSARSRRSERRPTAVERRLAALWRRVLGCGAVGLGDRFFDLGGHSLVAMEMLMLAEREFGVELDPRILLSSPSLAEMARLLTREAGAVEARRERPRHPLIVPIGARSGHPERPRVVCIHPLGGEILCYVDLADRLPRLSTVALQSPASAAEGNGSSAAALREEGSVHRLARRYRRILERTVGVPDVLVGWSLGALVAFEVASRWQRRGASPPVVVLVDPPAADGPRRVADRPLRLFLASLGLDPALAEEGDEDRPVTETLDALRRRGAARGVWPRALGAAELARRHRLFCAHERAVTRYRPSGRLRAGVTIVRADRGLVWPTPEGGWRRWVETPRVVRVAADHFSVLGAPAVDTVAAAVLDLLQRSTPRPEPPVVPVSGLPTPELEAFPR